jgi:hypothetical protein
VTGSMAAQLKSTAMARELEGDGGSTRGRKRALFFAWLDRGGDKGDDKTVSARGGASHQSGWCGE